MHTADADPAHDRTFAQVAGLLGAWIAAEDAAPGRYARAWARAGFQIHHVRALPFAHAIIQSRAPVVAGMLLPERGPTAPIYLEVLIVGAIARWERAGESAALAALHAALALAA